MTDQQPLSRRERRAHEREILHEAGGRHRQTGGRRDRGTRIRMAAFGGMVVAVLAVGGVLAFGDRRA